MAAAKGHPRPAQLDESSWQVSLTSAWSGTRLTWNRSGANGPSIGDMSGERALARHGRSAQDRIWWSTARHAVRRRRCGQDWL